MAPNNALGKATAKKLREKAEDGPALSKDEVRSRGVGTNSKVDSFIANPQSETRVFFTGVMFLTRLPCPPWVDHHPAFLVRSFAWFPLMGACIGLWQALLFDGCNVFLPPMPAAALATAGTVWLTGCLHEDGLGDSLDGFGGGWKPAEILRIMKDPRVGTYAAVGLCLWVITKITLLASLGAESSVWALAASQGAGPAMVVAHALARSTSAPLVYFCTYVVDDEDAKGEFYNWVAESKRLLGPLRVVLSVLGGAGMAFLLFEPTRAAVAVGVTILATVFAAFYGHRVIGGVMGDFLGATICCVEVAIYVALAADGSQFARVVEDQGWWVALRPLLLMLGVFFFPNWYQKGVQKLE